MGSLLALSIFLTVCVYSCHGTSQYSCPAGQKSLPGNTSCTECSLGKWKQAIGNSSCVPWSTTPCPSSQGWTAGNATADSLCSSCGAGSYTMPFVVPLSSIQYSLPSLNVPVQGSVAYHQYMYYAVRVPSNALTVTSFNVSVTPLTTGDPDLYVAYSSAQPSTSVKNWYSSKAGADSLQVSPLSVALPLRWFYVAIYGYSACSYIMQVMSCESLLLCICVCWRLFHPVCS